MRVFISSDDTLRFMGDAVEVLCPEILSSVDAVEPEDVFITHSEYDDAFIDQILAVKKRGGVTILLADGIFEWRNSFEHPPRMYSGFAREVWSGILSDYFLAFSYSQKYLIEEYNPGLKIEVIGSPRFDKFVRFYNKTVHSTPSDNGKFVILIASARKVGFRQSDVVDSITAYNDLREFFSTMGGDLECDIELLWRVSDEMAIELGLSQAEVNSGEGDLYQVLNEADAVICNPSTLMLEAMLLRKAVVCLDYTNSPRTFSCAWNIFTRSHIEDAVRSVMAWDSKRFVFQDYTLKQALCVVDCAGANLVAFVRKQASVISVSRPSIESSVRLAAEVKYLRYSANVQELCFQRRLDSLKKKLSDKDGKLKKLK